MKKQVIKLNESQLRKIIKENVKNILSANSSLEFKNKINTGNEQRHQTNVDV